MALPDASDSQLTHEHGQVRARSDLAEVLIGLAWLPALAAVPWWLLLLAWGAFNGQVGNCWPQDTSSGRWTPVVVLAIVGLLCDAGAFRGLRRKDPHLLRVTGLLSVVVFVLYLVLGPTTLDLIGAHIPNCGS